VPAGDIYWVELPRVNGHEQAGRRPAVLLSDEAYAGALPVVFPAPLTASLAARRFAGTVDVPATRKNARGAAQQIVQSHHEPIPIDPLPVPGAEPQLLVASSCL
jgi:mRNA-degrading endonuclease toxin of MazEF toxin-antitoxin module